MAIVILSLKLIKNSFSQEENDKTYFGLPTLNLFRSNEMVVGSSAPLQHVVMRTVDSVLLHLPTMMVTIGNACNIVRKQPLKWGVSDLHKQIYRPIKCNISKFEYQCDIELKFKNSM